MEKLYYTIGEVSEMIGENISLIRFWSNSFPKFIKPVRTAKGNRQYTASDLAALKQIHYLVKDQGLTLEGAARQMAANKAVVSGKVKALESLKEIRAQLVEIKKNIC